MPSFILADYIESGAFQASEEDVFRAKIKYDEVVVVMKKSERRKLLDTITGLRVELAKHDPEHKL